MVTRDGRATPFDMGWCKREISWRKWQVFPELHRQWHGEIIHNSYSTTLAHRDVFPTCYGAQHSDVVENKCSRIYAVSIPCETPLDIYMRGKRSQQKTSCAVWVCSRKSPAFHNVDPANTWTGADGSILREYKLSWSEWSHRQWE